MHRETSSLRLGGDMTGARLPVNLTAARWVAENVQPAGLGTETYPGGFGLACADDRGARTIGVLGVRPHDVDRFLEADERRMLETCANLFALSIEQ